MRLVTFVHEHGPRLGALIEAENLDWVVDLNVSDSRLPADMRSLLEMGDAAWRILGETFATPKVIPLHDRGVPLEAIHRRSDVRLQAVVPNPEKLICIGLNYRDHALETGRPIPEVPTIFAKYANVLIGDGEPIVIPSTTDQVDYEAELAFVIGRRARHVSEAEAMQHVAGYAAFNDVTARDYQARTSQWTLGKSFDSFGPLGPALVTLDELPDPGALGIRLRIGDETLQQSNTREMLFPIPRLVAYLSEVMTLEPGDVVATGTPAGVGFIRRPPRFLRAGDNVRVEIDGVGVLENPVVAE